MSIRITAYNRGPDPATLHIIPQLWFRNTWSWPKDRPTGKQMPSMQQVSEGVIQTDQEHLGRYYFHATTSPAPVHPDAQQSNGNDDDDVVPELMFTDNDTNLMRLYGAKNVTPYVKDAFHDHIISSHRPQVGLMSTPLADEGVEDTGDATPPTPTTPTAGDNSTIFEDYERNRTQTPTPPRQFINPDKRGTKAGAHYVFNDVPGNGGCAVVRVKLTPKGTEEDSSILDEEEFDCVIEERRSDADEFYSRFNSGALSDDLRNIMRQALSGMLWTKQFYHFIQKEWIEGDPGQPPPPPERKWIRNQVRLFSPETSVSSLIPAFDRIKAMATHVYRRYPFHARQVGVSVLCHLGYCRLFSSASASDFQLIRSEFSQAFHCIPLAMVDPAYAKKQLDIMTREWYMKPDGALPAYEWNFSDVNPPVHAWSVSFAPVPLFDAHEKCQLNRATFRVFKIERKMHGRADLQFLERVFQKLLINFTWCVRCI